MMETLWKHCSGWISDPARKRTSRFQIAEIHFCARSQYEYSEPVPDDMSVFDVPAATYVVVTQHGPLSDEKHGLGAALNYVYREWLPRSGYQRAATPDLEWYDERFHGDQEDSEMDVYTPIVAV
jgi:predicted transcriptional regulator YdeE